MSAGHKEFLNNGLYGLAEMYESFPQRLRQNVIEEHAKIYNSLYSLLTKEEKDELNEIYQIDSIDQFHNNIILFNGMLSDKIKSLDHLNGLDFSEEGTRKRFSNWNEKFIQSRLSEYQEQRDVLLNEIAGLKSNIETLEREASERQSNAKLFI